MSWHENRFTDRPGAVRQDCVSCGRPMWFPPSKAGKYLTCSDKCRAAQREAARAARTRPCETCGSPFAPRPGQVKLGHGKYCSLKCSEHNLHIKTPEIEAKRVAALKGKPGLKGPDSPMWKGGVWKVPTRSELAARLRDYRRRNPDKVREFRRTRQGRKMGRLPRGTIKRIGELQRWLCPACQVDILSGYHMDHIVALANGGKHEPTNIQLLCGPCNLRKAAKDPIEFMQEMGFLL